MYNVVGGLAAKCLTIIAANCIEIVFQVGGDKNILDILDDANIFRNVSYSYIKEEFEDVYSICYGEKKEK